VDDSRLGVSSVAFSPNSRALASCSGKIVRLWDPATGKLQMASSELGHVRSAAFWGDGDTLAINTGGDTLTLCDARSLAIRDVRRTKPQSAGLLLGHDDSIRRIVYSSDRRLVAFAGGWHPQAPGRLTIWETRRARLVTSFSTSSGCVRAVAFSADARLLAYAIGSSIRLVDVERLPQPQSTR
jgi:WD40 repeat protein